MTETTIDRRKCDQCGKVEDFDRSQIGSLPFTHGITVTHIECGSLKTLHFCCGECLVRRFEG